MYDVIIIGCGVTGAAAAFELSKYDLSVAVLERENDVAEGTTKANSAILHAGYDPIPGTLMAQLNRRGTELGKELCKALDVPLKVCGSLVAAFSEEERPALEELLRRGQENGVEGLVILSGDQARAMEPQLSPNVVAALYAPTAAVCSPWEYCLALMETAIQNGANLHLETPVTGLTRENGFWRVLTPKGEFEARYILNAAGVDAAAVHDMAAPHDFDILPSRGEYYLLDKSEGDRVDHVIFQCPTQRGKGILVAPTVHGNLLTGPNAQDVSGDDTATTADGLAHVRATALLSVPTVDFRAAIRCFAGVRAHSGEGDFILRPAQGAQGFIDLAGICSPGLSAAPAIAEYAAQLLREAGLVLTKKDRFTMERRRVRFKDLSPAEKADLVRREPAYGRVICRCETVTEGEILATFRTPIPPRSIDAVKRRVNAGMGRCQGGFCGPRVAELLSKELGIPLGEVPQGRVGTRLLDSETRKGDRHG